MPFEVIVSVGMDESVGLVQKLFSYSRFLAEEGMIYLIKFSEGGCTEENVNADEIKLCVRLSALMFVDNTPRHSFLAYDSKSTDLMRYFSPELKLCNVMDIIYGGGISGFVFNSSTKHVERVLFQK